MEPHACYEPPCPAGLAVADRSAHAAWHADLRQELNDANGISVGELVATWLDELDPAVIEQLVLAGEPTMSDSPVAGVLEVLRKLARE